MKSVTISELPSNILLGVFYSVLSYSILNNHMTRIGTYLYTAFGVNSEVTSNIIGLLLGAGAVYMLIGDTTGNRFKVAAFPMMLYLGLSTVALIASANAPGGIEMVAFFTILLLYRDWDADARRRSLEEFAHAKVTEISRLQAELEKFKPKEG